MAVTMSDVAQAAGVSTATVSNVINGRPGKVGEKTRRRILRVMDELGYQVNLNARQLRAGRSDVIGLVVPELDRPYFGELATRLADQLEVRGRHLVMQRSGVTRESELAALSLARLAQYDGVVVTVVDLAPADLDRLDLSAPVVLVGERAVPHRFDQVLLDNVGGAELATSHLIAQGARRIALLGGVAGDAESADGMSAMRTVGYRAAHAKAGLEVDEELIVPLALVDLAAGRAAVRELGRRGVPFDAVFAVTDVVAMGALRGLADLGRAVPGDVQVAGFDDVAEAAYLVPSLTTIDPGHDRIAETILELLETRMAPETSDREPRRVVLPAQLIQRESTRPMPATSRTTGSRS